MSETKSIETRTSPISWFDRFCFVARRDDPKTHPAWQKNAIVGIVTLSAFTAPFASCILFPSFGILVEHFHTTQTKVALTTTVFLLGLAAAPLWWSTLSQQYGRRPVLVFSFLISTVAVIVCAATNSLPLIIVFRLIEALGCSSAQSVGAGVISDIYNSTERGSALGWFYLGTLIGPLVAPVIGGALQVWLGWRANLYFMAIFTFTTSILTMLCLPETLAKVSTPKHEKLPWYHHVQRDVLAPLPKLKFLLVASISLTIAYISICFASLYCFNTTLPYAYSAPPYNFSAIEIGLCYISNCLGYAIGSVVGGKLSDAKLRQYQATHNGDINPTERIKTVWYGVGFVPAGLLIYGWLVENKVFWIAPLVGAFLFGLGLMLVTSTVMPFLVDIKPGMGASVVANLNLVRNVLAAIGTVLSPIAVTIIGFGWWMTILAILCSFSVIFIVIVIWKEAAERKKSMSGGAV
ncbi:Major facilitator superfamily domain general substrate transporter [Penicillium nucicola]|uniref:Major facilitator superfamily domain general substrate transporter n=1 Tax=Penicillium nucicola TaxID=1850975 RepID=UPI0025451C00|nr:Major facilitator superfamily domain general substrate transporter [Penicillium nucicola]KAJ5770271.1 Major facilitator superfamily domain general substrate transporter [Penicillium nucicola]